MWFFFSFSFRGLISRYVSIFSNATFILSLCVLDSGIFVVEQIPLCWRFMCPLLVAVDDPGMCLWKSAAVRPSHVVSFLFSIALTNVRFFGPKRHWCRYRISASLFLIAYALAAIWFLVEPLSISKSQIFSFGSTLPPFELIGSTHNTIAGYLPLVHTIHCFYDCWFLSMTKFSFCKLFTNTHPIPTPVPSGRVLCCPFNQARHTVWDWSRGTLEMWPYLAQLNWYPAWSTS